MKFTGEHPAWSWKATDKTLTITMAGDRSSLYACPIYAYPIKWVNGEIILIGNVTYKEHWSHDAIKYISKQYKAYITEQILREK